MTANESSSGRQAVTLVRAGNAEDVRSLYEQYPYPSPIVGDSLIEDVANSLRFLWKNDELEGKRILDAGCGAGHRLLGAARRFPKATFYGVDMTLASLDTARRLADKHKIANVRFEQADLMDLRLDGEFDVIVSTGVIHHLESPPRGLSNLCSLLAKDGVLIVWHYHSLGEHQRLCDREMFLTLWGGVRSDRDQGLQLLTELNLSLDVKQYGSTASQREGEVARVNIDVDAYMHPIVNAYRFEEGIEMFNGCPVDWVAVNGVNLKNVSKLIDLAEVDKSESSLFCVQVDDLFKRESLRSRYRRLDKISKLKVLELMLRPTGFTILAGRGAPSRLGSRVAGNIVSA